MLSKVYTEKGKNFWPKILVGLFLFKIIFIVISVLIFNSMVSSPNSTVDEKVEFVVEEGQGVKVITENLTDEDLLNHPLVFMIYLRYKGLTSDLKAGHYDLNKNMSILDVVDVLTGGKVKSSKVTIVEGLRVEEVAKKLAADNIVRETDFLEMVKGTYEYDFLKDKPVDQTLEGYLFPDTYFLPAEVTSEQIIEKMLANFSKKFTSELEQAAASQGFSIHEIITLASIVEKEVSKKEDKEKVAGVLKNRLDINMALQADATNHYVIGDWKKTLAAADLNIDSPYNTRKYRGLPPGPICSPGLDSIIAAIHHKESDYLYYLSDKDGVTHFSYTKDEHDEKKAIYLD